MSIPLNQHSSPLPNTNFTSHGPQVSGGPRSRNLLQLVSSAPLPLSPGLEDRAATTTSSSAPRHWASTSSYGSSSVPNQTNPHFGMETGTGDPGATDGFGEAGGQASGEAISHQGGSKDSSGAPSPSMGSALGQRYSPADSASTAPTSPIQPTRRRGAGARFMAHSLSTTAKALHLPHLSDHLLEHFTESQEPTDANRNHDSFARRHMIASAPLKTHPSPLHVPESASRARAHADAFVPSSAPSSTVASFPLGPGSVEVKPPAKPLAKQAHVKHALVSTGSTGEHEHGSHKGPNTSSVAPWEDMPLFRPASRKLLPMGPTPKSSFSGTTSSAADLSRSTPASYPPLSSLVVSSLSASDLSEERDSPADCCKGKYPHDDGEEPLSSGERDQVDLSSSLQSGLPLCTSAPLAPYGRNTREAIAPWDAFDFPSEEEGRDMVCAPLEVEPYTMVLPIPLPLSDALVYHDAQAGKKQDQRVPRSTEPLAPLRWLRIAYTPFSDVSSRAVGPAPQAQTFRVTAQLYPAPEAKIKGDSELEKELDCGLDEELAELGIGFAPQVSDPASGCPISTMSPVFPATPMSALSVSTTSNTAKPEAKQAREPPEDTLPPPMSFPTVLGFCSPHRKLELIPDGWTALGCPFPPSTASFSPDSPRDRLWFGVPELILTGATIMMDL